MRMLYHRPGPPLADFVEVFWLSENRVQAHAMERCLPSGSMQVIFNLRGETLRVYGQHGEQNEKQIMTVRGPLVTGPRDEYTVIDTAQQEALLGIAFRPGGALPFLRLPVSELRNTDVALEELWGADAHELHAHILAAPTAPALFETLEAALRARLACASGRYAVQHRAVAFALGAFSAVPRTSTVGAVTECAGLSARHFAQVFGEAVGLTPKMYCRVRRFQAALAGISRAEAVSWAALAASYGYYDQAHFIHDFRAFAGLTPSAYLARRSAHQNHVPLDTPVIRAG